MAKKVKAVVKLQIPAGKANPAPPVGPALGQHGLNIMAFCKEYNARTASHDGLRYPGRNHHLSGPNLYLRHQNPAGQRSCSRKRPASTKGPASRTARQVGNDYPRPVREIAETKMKDLNAVDIEGAMQQIEGSARSMGITIVD